MSAIWGTISLNNLFVNSNCLEIFHQTYSNCKIDRSESLSFSNGIIGCEIQYFTKEASFERLPINKEDSFLFTADVCLDNREELLLDSLFSDSNHETIPDGTILFEIYHKYGPNGLKKAYGSYSFVYYNAQKQYIDIVMDHTGNRCLYYSFSDGVVSFSTLISPLLYITPSKPQLNEKSLANFLSSKEFLVYQNPEDTFFTDVKHALPGEIIRISLNGIQHFSYWNPIKLLNSLSNKTDSEYCQLFTDCFQKCVKESLRTDGEVGILLSSGFDSTSVACFASPLLKKSGKKLFSYTMIPQKDFINDLPAHHNPNEEPQVKSTSDFLGNVVPHFDSFDDYDPWLCLNQQIAHLEEPYKSLQNSLGLYHLTEMAHADNCKILLNGGFGNETISYSNPISFLFETLIHFRFFTFFKEIFSKGTFVYRKKFILHSLIQYLLPPKRNYESPKEYNNNSFLNSNTIEKYHLYQNYKKRTIRLKNVKTRKKYLYIALDKLALRQMGDYQTKDSLFLGVLSKDPTKSPRLIELCFSFPSDQFDKNCIPKRLVNHYLKDILPPHITDPKLPRGKQSADLKFRLDKNINDIFETLKKDFSDDNKLIDSQKVLSKLNELEKSYPEINLRDLEQLIFVDEIIRFQRMYS